MRTVELSALTERSHYITFGGRPQRTVHHVRVSQRMRNATVPKIHQALFVVIVVIVVVVARVNIPVHRLSNNERYQTIFHFDFYFRFYSYNYKIHKAILSIVLLI